MSLRLGIDRVPRPLSSPSIWLQCPMPKRSRIAY